MYDEEWAKKPEHKKVVDPLGVAGTTHTIGKSTRRDQDTEVLKEAYTGSINNDLLYRYR